MEVIMFKYRLIKGIKLVLFLVLLGIGTLSHLHGGEVEFFFNGGINTGSNYIDTTNYSWDWSADYVDVAEDGLIDPHLTTGKLSFSAGLTYYYSPHFGISFSVTHTKRDINLFADYSIDWTWFDGENFSRNKSWDNTGSVSITPIMMDIIYQVFLFQNTNLNLRFGVGLFLTQLDFDSHVGFAETLETDEYYYLDWYDLDVFISQKKTYIGGDIGVDIEHKITDHLGVYVGFQYFYVPTKNIKINVVPFEEYYGQEGQLFTTAVPDIHFDQPIIIKMKFSFVRAFLGMKVYL